MTILQFIANTWQLHAGDIAVFTFWACVGCGVWMVIYTLLEALRAFGLIAKPIAIYENFGVEASRY